MTAEAASIGPLSGRAELQTIEQTLANATALTPAARALLHRDAVYLALDLGDVAGAMAHALACLELARSSGDASLQVKAHVALALVQADSYDDQGASTHFALADTLARKVGDDRGVALVAINAAHHELERRRYRAALSVLLALIQSPHLRSLSRPDSTHLNGIFHMNFVVSAAECFIAGDDLGGAEPAVEAQLLASATFLQQAALEVAHTPVVDAAGVFDALTRHALWMGDLATARDLADEHVRITHAADLPLLYGRALLDRSRVHAATGDLDSAILDAELAVRYFGEASSILWEARSRETLAAAYARAGRYRDAYETQLAVTLGVENLYRDYHQQRALVGQIEQQARDAEVRAQALAEAALRDPLTGAPNRTQAMQVLGDLHRRAQHGQASAIALLDLDLFKRVNDTYGHLVGDAVLIEATRLLSAELREQDLLARLGGEEFLVILTDVTVDEAAVVCARLRDTLHRASWETLAPGLVTSGSFGVAVLDGKHDITGTLKVADQALYAAKAAGRNTVRVAPAHDAG
ncbi:GGDEF domain-containing protein [Deinococcus sp. KSM4-11]|uniref:GGDEF domain-containing protein n=1 Tax=Deinococcus sp. KSM4-11 TaxID=2568654 RepID=UPI0010A4C50A|nr:GGDEF domain-containing protein [Deinococcus sp. KSM4-11]THF88931.1 GGDEF domain-containing protein [Deinococcus sp. KSM4-11]